MIFHLRLKVMVVHKCRRSGQKCLEKILPEQISDSGIFRFCSLSPSFVCLLWKSTSFLYTSCLHFAAYLSSWDQLGNLIGDICIMMRLGVQAGWNAPTKASVEPKKKPVAEVRQSWVVEAQFWAHSHLMSCGATVTVQPLHCSALVISNDMSLAKATGALLGHMEEEQGANGIKKKRGGTSEHSAVVPTG